MKKAAFITTMLVGILSIGPIAFSFDSNEVIFDGQDGEYVYISIKLKNVGELKNEEGTVVCDKDACPFWTARLWDTSNPTIVHSAGAQYNTLDDLYQGMTFVLPSADTPYNELEVVSFNANGEPITRRTIAARDAGNVWIVSEQVEAIPPEPEVLGENVEEPEVLVPTVEEPVIEPAPQQPPIEPEPIPESTPEPIATEEPLQNPDPLPSEEIPVEEPVQQQEMVDTPPAETVSDAQ
jgi:hypothetical protein